MTFQPEIDRTLTLLQAELRRRGLTQQEVQRRLGWGKNYLSELFAMEKSLRFDQTLAILAVIGVAPATFYAELYRWPLARAVPADQPSSAEPASAQAIFAAAKQEVDRLLMLLRQKIEENGFTQIEIQARLNRGQGYVSRLLRPGTSPRYDQVLAILEVIGVTPEEFFAEVFRPRRDPEKITVSDLVRALTAKGLLSEEDLAAAAWPGRGGAAD